MFRSLNNQAEIISESEFRNMHPNSLFPEKILNSHANPLGWETYVPAHEEPVIHWPTEIAKERWKREVSGTTFSGFVLDTGRDNQSLIAGAALAAVINPDYNVRWKTSAGFVELNAQQIIAAASAVRAHVQACFDREAVLLQEIEGGTFTESMLNEGWPS